MGQCFGCSKGTSPAPRRGSLTTLRRGTHTITSKPTGTLIFTANYREQLGQSKPHDSLIIAGNLFFGLFIDYDEIEVKEQIGSGSYGFVCKARYEVQSPGF